MFKIGEFSKLVRVSPRMLRHYEKCGLLYPAEIDKFTGYRQYSAAQIPLLNKIVLLRDLGFSIGEIGDILPYFDNAAYMNKVLRNKAASVKIVIDKEQDKYDRLIKMSNTMRKELNIMIYEVELKKLPAVKVISLRGIIPHYRDEGILWEKLGRFIGQNKIKYKDNESYSSFIDDEYKESNPDIEIAIPVESLGEDSEDFIYKEYEEIPLAATIRFSGTFDGGYDAVNEKLAKWMEQNRYCFCGTLRSCTLISPHDDPNPDNRLVELQAPVMKK